MPSHRLLFSLSASVFLHLAAFGTGDLLCRMQEKGSRPPFARMDATLRLPRPETPAEALLKDTMATGKERSSHAAKPVPETRGLRAVVNAQRKLSKHIFYPKAAVAAGIEGDVRLLVTLDDRGHIKEVEIADSSGYAILDQAAIRAAYAMGSVRGTDRHELILPVTFRLQP